jgi:hypothetical protein
LSLILIRQILGADIAAIVAVTEYESSSMHFATRQSHTNGIEGPRSLDKGASASGCGALHSASKNRLDEPIGIQVIDIRVKVERVKSYDPPGSEEKPSSNGA